MFLAAPIPLSGSDPRRDRRVTLGDLYGELAKAARGSTEGRCASRAGLVGVSGEAARARPISTDWRLTMGMALPLALAASPAQSDEPRILEAAGR